MKFYLVLWHRTDRDLNGWDLVYAIDKKAARRKYREEHNSPIDAIASQADEKLRAIKDDLNPITDSLFYSISPKEYALAIAGQVVTIEEGT